MGLWGARVVVVEDEPETLRLVTHVLESEGAQVLAVTAPGQALCTIAGMMPDVILVSLEMAGLDGAALMRKVRTLSPEKGGRVPAAALSTGAPGPLAEEVLRADGFQAHLAKPILDSELRAWVEALSGGAVERRHQERDRRQWPDTRRDRRREVRGTPVRGGQPRGGSA
jgi:CheY-like chemotaxis protein